MKTIKRITICCLVVLLVCATYTTAFAESVSYNGKCYNRFTASRTLSKVNDTTLENVASLSQNVTETEMLGDCCGVGTSFTSRMLIAGAVRSTKPDMWAQVVHKFVDSARYYKGTCQLQICNTDTDAQGDQIHVIGTFSIKP